MTAIFLLNSPAGRLRRRWPRLLAGGLALGGYLALPERSLPSLFDSWLASPGESRRSASLLGAKRSVAAYRSPPRGSDGAVAADHELASRAGAQVLAQGGNAVDAAIATALALGVVQPAGSGLGGGGFLLVRRAPLAGEPAAGTVRLLDFREVAPQAARANMFIDPATGQPLPERSRHGGLAVGVPGEAAGFDLALRELGSLTPAQVIAPALKLASDGFPVGRHLARSIANTVPKLAEGSPLRLALAPGGSPLRLGDLWRRPELSTTLATLGRDGFTAFYRTSPGAIGDDLVRATAATGGVLTAADLQRYRPVERPPLHGQYRGWQIYSVPPPGGGLTALEALQILDAGPGLRDGPGASATLHAEIEALKHAFADRARYLGDPAFDQVPVSELISPAFAAARAAQLQPDRVLPAAEYGRPRPGPPLEKPRDHGTTHICVIDKAGNAAALTTTINLAFGAHLVAGKSGILLNNQMDDFAAAPSRPNAFGLVGSGANAIAAGKRPASSMTPLLAVAPDGRVLCAGGSGGPTIVTGVVQTVVNVIDFQMDLEAAVGSPRIHAQYIPPEVLVEPEVVADVRSALSQRGHKLIVTPSPIEGAVQAVLWQPVGSGPAGRAAEIDSRPFSAASDARKGGLPALP